MKKTLLVLAASFLFAGCSEAPKNNAEINGTVTGLEDGTKVYLSRYDGKMEKLDSTVLAESKFSFTVEEVYPEQLFIQFDEQRGIFPFIAEKGEIQIEAAFDGEADFTASGTRSNDLSAEFGKQTKSLNEKKNDLYEKYRSAENDEERKAVYDEIGQVDDQLNEMQAKFVADHKNETIAAYFLGRESTYGFTPEKMDSLMGLLGTEIPDNKFLDKMKERREVLVKTAPGQPAPDFTLPQPDGTPFSLSSLRGQVVMVDFWAAWCGPCRRENPNMVKMYNKYKDHGFTIVGVSLDEDRERWLEAIEKDGLTWTHVSELKRFNTQPVKDYGVVAIPHTVLINQEGVIVGNVVFGEKLDKLIAETLGLE